MGQLTREALKNIVREVMKEETAYQKVFRKVMAKYGINSPEELQSDEEKKKFFTTVDTIYKAKNEDLVGGQKKLDLDKDGDISADDLAALRAKKNESKLTEDEKWIQKATDPKKKGQLHKDLGVPEDQTIPDSKLRAAAQRKDKVGQRARFAMNVKGLK